MPNEDVLMAFWIVALVFALFKATYYLGQFIGDIPWKRK
jgi:hypothetical protein